MRSVFKVLFIFLIFLVGIYLRLEYVQQDGEYLLGADPYYHYRMAETILSQGKRPEWDYLACYPTGKPVTYPPLFQYYIAYSFRVIGNLLGLDLFQWCIYANIIPFFCCVVLMFLLGALLTNDFGGFCAALLFATIPAITVRTLIGFTDTDMFVLLFSLLCFFFFILSVRPPERNRRILQPISAFLCGGSLFLFSQTWSGYWYMLPLLSAGFVVWIGEKREYKRLELLIIFLVTFVTLLAFSAASYLEILVLLIIFLGFEVSVHRLDISRLYAAAGILLIGFALWIVYVHDVISPLIYMLPFKLDPGSSVLSHNITQMIVDNFVMTPRLAWELLGPSLFLAPFGLYILFKRKVWWLFVLLLLDITGTALMLLRGGRFSLLLAVPLCLTAAVFLVYLSQRLSKKYEEYGTPIVAFVLIIVLCTNVVYSEKVNQGSQFMNDDLWNALTWIEENTPSDSVIIGHWGMGYFIESVAQRHSVMNGSQYDLFWRMVKFGTILTTEDEEIAMQEIYGFDSESTVLDLRTLSADQTLARQQLEEEMTPFAERDAYVIVDEYTATTLGWWSKYGTWNYATQRGNQYYYNAAFLASGRKLGKIIEYKFRGGQDLIVLYRAQDEFHGFVPQGGQLVPARGTIFFKERLKHFLVQEEGAYGVIFLPYSEEEHLGEDPIFHYMSTYILGIPEKLENVMLTRLYFLDGEGLKYFELVKEVGKVKVYKVHQMTQENLSQGVIIEADEFSLVAVPT